MTTPPRVPAWLRRALAAALAVLALPVWAEGASDAELKAAFIYNFAKYVDWPASALESTPGVLTLCVVGERDTLFDALVELAGKHVRESSLRVRNPGRNESLRNCQVVVVGESDSGTLEAVLRPLLGTPVLTVGSSERFLDANGVIRLVAEGNKMRFDINLGAARRNNLLLSSKLLKLARQVRQR